MTQTPASCGRLSSFPSEKGGGTGSGSTAPVAGFALEEQLHPGSIACAGCGALLALRHTLNTLGPRTMFVNSTGCSAVIMQMGVPNVPHFHTLFENGPAVLSGIDAGLRALHKRDGVHLLNFAGDGGTADIGLAALSGAVERGHRMVYVCYDNESYMNTGGQRSGTTPFGARTTTTPVGRAQRGETRASALCKDVPAMMLAQGCPYVAVTSIAYPEDLVARIARARDTQGPSYVHIHAPCPTGWGFDAGRTVEVARLAVQSGAVDLWEAVSGKKIPTVVVAPEQRVHPDVYRRLQRRFAHIGD